MIHAALKTADPTTRDSRFYSTETIVISSLVLVRAVYILALKFLPEEVARDLRRQLYPSNTIILARA